MDNSSAPESKVVEAINDEKIIFQQINDNTISYSKQLKGRDTNTVHQIQSSNLYGFIVVCTPNGLDVVLSDKYEAFSNSYDISFTVKVF